MSFCKRSRTEKKGRNAVQKQQDPKQGGNWDCSRLKDEMTCAFFVKNETLSGGKKP